MASKYAKVIHGLEKMPVEFTDGGTDYQYEVNMFKNTIEDKEPASLARAWKALRAEKAIIKQHEKGINLQIRAFEQLLEEAYEGAGIEKLNLSEGGSVAMQPDPYVRVVDPEKYRQHCIESGLLPLMSIPYMTTKANARELLLEGEDTPPGVEIFAKWRFTLYKG